MQRMIELAREARDMGMLFILLTGGEVLLEVIFRNLFEISMMGLTTTIYSNGTLTPQIASWLGSRPPLRLKLPYMEHHRKAMRKSVAMVMVFIGHFGGLIYY